MVQETKPRRSFKFLKFMEENYDKPTWILYGGSGGGKSHSVVDHLVVVCASVPNLSIMVTRKTRPALKATTWRMFLQALDNYALLQGRDYEVNRTDLEIKFKNETIVRFTSIDDPQKIKSSSVNVVYIEEVTEFTKEDYFFIQNAIRRPMEGGYPNRLIATFNPVDINHWVWQQIVLRRDVAKCALLHSTYKDNPFLPPEYCRMLEAQSEIDENFYRVYTLGEPGVLENSIYTNYQIASFPAIHWTQAGAIGVDFGYTAPAAVVEVYLQGDVLYAREHVYESHLTNSELIDKVKELGNLSRLPIYCDSAEPDRIEEFARAGLSVQPSNKNIKLGIDFCKRKQIVIDPNSTHLIEEIRSYQYRKDRNGTILEEPSKVRDHALDAFRYAAFTHYGKDQSLDAYPDSFIGFGGVSEDTQQFVDSAGIVYNVAFGMNE